MEIVKCKKCGKKLCHVKIPWDSAGGEEYFCLKCEPLTKEEKEYLDYAKFKK